MNAIINQINNLLVIETNVKRDKNFSHQINLYFKVLSKEVLGNEISLITLQPQSYSLANEIKGSNKVEKIAGKTFLFSNGINCNEDLLFKIIQSEEFRRGLLYIVYGNEKGLEEIAESIVKYFKERGVMSLNAVARVCFTENDGNTLCLYNTGLTKENLHTVLIE